MIAILILGFCGLVAFGVAVTGIGGSIASSKPNPSEKANRDAANRAWAKECAARNEVARQCTARIARLAAEHH